jgi:hypothetical protein
VAKFGNTRPVKKTLTVDTSAYTAGDSVGGLVAVEALGATTGRGVLKHVTVTDFDNQKSALTILFFDSLPAATITDQAAFPDLATGDLGKVIGKVVVAADDYTTIGTRAVATVECSICLWSLQATTDGLPADQRRVYMAVVAGGTPDYSAADAVRVHLGTLLD